MIKILSSLLLTLLFAVPAFSQMDMSKKDKAGHGMMMKMDHMDMMGDSMDMCLEHADQLGLTDDQIQKMKPLHNDMQKKHARFQADVKIAEIDLMEIVEEKDFDLNKATSGVKNIMDIKLAHHLDMLKNMKEMRTILTDEQFKGMKRIMMSMKTHDDPSEQNMKKHK